MNQKNLHAVLGVSEKASPEELRRAYLALAVKYHPDRNPGDPDAEERFKDISQAYAILSDPRARARYERVRPQKKPDQKNQGRAAGAGAKKETPKGGNGGAASTAGGPGSGTAGGPGRASQQRSAGETKSRSARAGASGRPATGAADFDEILTKFFKSDKGRDTLRDLEAEMTKAGLKFTAEDFAGWVKSRQKPAAKNAPPQKSLWERLTAMLPGAETRARKKAELFEINYQIALTPQAAAKGTMVEISYPRGDRQPHHLKVRIPGGVRDGSRLRLTGQGRRRPGPDPDSRGDLILSIIIVPGNTVAGLWTARTK